MEEGPGQLRREAAAVDLDLAFWARWVDSPNYFPDWESARWLTGALEVRGVVSRWHDGAAWHTGRHVTPIGKPRGT